MGNLANLEQLLMKAVDVCNHEGGGGGGGGGGGRVCGVCLACDVMMV